MSLAGLRRAISADGALPRQAEASTGRTRWRRCSERDKGVGGGGGERARALLLLARWEEMRGSRGGGCGETGVGEVGGARGPPDATRLASPAYDRHVAAVALAWSGRHAGAGAGERTGQARPASAVG
jgi:hypothetical protein